MQTFDQIISIVGGVCHHPYSTDVNSTPKSIKLSVDDLQLMMQELLNNSMLYFDSLSCVTGIDNGPAMGTMEVAYNLYSIPFNHHLMVKVETAREGASVPSVCHLWRTAEWHEREIFDMFGIHFSNHPDLRRILMPSDWEGHPLKKDYKQQEYYRDIKVEF
ncbi:MAG: NADH-quinone oxidoreductase subunit C [Chryseolinea sp.]